LSEERPNEWTKERRLDPPEPFAFVFAEKEEALEMKGEDEAVVVLLDADVDMGVTEDVEVGIEVGPAEVFAPGLEMPSGFAPGTSFSAWIDWDRV
jgi:hypothetical protein